MVKCEAYEINRKYHEKRLLACDAYQFFKDKGLAVEICHHGLEINSKYIYSPFTSRWTTKGNRKWYWHKGYEDFYERFVKE